MLNLCEAYIAGSIHGLILLSLQGIFVKRRLASHALTCEERPIPWTGKSAPQRFGGRHD